MIFFLFFVFRWKNEEVRFVRRSMIKQKWQRKMNCQTKKKWLKWKKEENWLLKIKKRGSSVKLHPFSRLLLLQFFSFSLPLPYCLSNFIHIIFSEKSILRRRRKKTIQINIKKTILIRLLLTQNFFWFNTIFWKISDLVLKHALHSLGGVGGGWDYFYGFWFRRNKSLVYGHVPNFCRSFKQRLQSFQSKWLCSSEKTHLKTPINLFWLKSRGCPIFSLPHLQRTSNSNIFKFSLQLTRV